MLNKKSIIAQIQKLAQDADLPLGPKKPAPPAAGNEFTGPEQVYGPPSPPKREFVGPPPLNQPANKPQPTANAGIKAMQQALIDLSKAVTSQINVQEVATGDERQKQEASGRNSFGDFIAKNYLRDSDVPGVEFDPSPNKSQLSQKTPGEPSRMNVIMDTMKRIGNPKGGEFAVDGQWGPRTNAGVHNAYALAYSLLKLAADFKLPIKSFTNEDLEAFKKEIPEEDKQLTILQKVEMAPYLTGVIKKIQAMYNEIKNGVLEKPAYRAYIENQQPFATYKNNKVNVTPEQIEALNGKYSFKITQNTEAGSTVKPISVKDFGSIQALKEWQAKNMPQMPIPNILIEIKKQLSNLSA